MRFGRFVYRNRLPKFVKSGLIYSGFYRPKIHVKEINEAMITYEHNGKVYSAVRIEQKDGYFVAFDVTCEGESYVRMLVRNVK